MTTALENLLMMTLLLVAVSCQPLYLTHTDLSDKKIQSRRLTAYSSKSEDDDAYTDDARLQVILVSVAAAIGLASLVATFALCACCPTRSKRHYK